MDAASNATAVAALQCPASSPVLLFLAGVLASINNKREAERAQRRQEGNGALSEYDYVVVGGGSSGCAVAARLSEDRSVSVLLLERGGREPEEARVPAYSFNNIKSDMAEVYRAEPESQNCNSTGCVINVPAVLGGGSTLNGMLYVRGSKEDYEEWARLTEDRGWAYDSVLQYFKKAEDNLNPTISENRRYHGRGGPQKVSWEPYRHPAMALFQRAFQAAGVPFRLDINAESQLGHSVVQTTTAAGERWSTYRSYVEPVLRRANLRVETFATARRVVLDAEGRDGLRAVGVEYEDARGQIRVVGAKREVVLTAGAVHTPQLLMLSGIGPASQLRALSIPPLRDLPVGERLMDHPDVSGVPYKCAPPLCVTDWQSRLGDLRQYRENRTGPLSAVNFPHLMSFTRSSLAKPLTGDQPDVQIQLVGRTVDGNVNCLPQDAWRLNRVVPIVSLMRPYSEGWVRLNTSNPYGRPLVKFNYFGDADGHDIAVVNEGLKLGLRLNATLATFGLTLDKDSVRDCTLAVPTGPNMEIIPSNKGKATLCLNGFTYTEHSRNLRLRKIYWRCTERDRCNARTHTSLDLEEPELLKDGTEAHIGHEADHRAVIAKKVMQGVKRRAEQHPNEPPQQALRDAVGNVDDPEVLAKLPERNSMRRVINLHQNIGRPRNPVTVQDILMAAPYTTTKRGTRYLLFDSGQDDADRVLVFCSEEQLKILCASNEIFADGTFKTVPNQFGQLYTIHGTVVDTAQRKLVFPLVSCICVRKNEATYQQIWDAIIDEAGRLNLQFKVNLMMTDFELAAMNVHQRAFPFAAHKGCLFHFNQALWRYVVNEGLRVLYINAEQEDHTVRRDVQRLMAIPFVPLTTWSRSSTRSSMSWTTACWAWPPTWSRTTSGDIVRCGAAMPYRHVSPRNCGTCMNRPWTTPSAPTTWLRPTTRNSRN